MSLWDRLTDGVAAGRASLHCWTGDRFEAALWRDVVRDAEAMTAGLRRAGVQPGSCAATVLTNGPDAVRGILATWLAGGTIASLPVPARGMDLDEYAEQLTSICAQLEPAVFLMEERMLGLLPEDLRERLGARSWESFSGSGRVEPAPPGDDEVAFIQYSSGSTSMPKGCMLSPRAIEAQLELLKVMFDGDPSSDVGYSWLPLSHDMGIFGNLILAWAHDGEQYLSTPERFLMSPRTWFEETAECGATVTCGTNTALAMAVRGQRGKRLSKPLNLHTVILGAERNDWDTLSGAIDAFGPYGLTPQAMMPAYGLAEATLAVTATPRREMPRYLAVDAVALADGDVQEVEAMHPSATRIVSAGPPCLGVELPGLEEDQLTEVRVRSDCLAEGYFGDPERTRERFRDGEFWTGDLAFARDGYLFPVGRGDDVISVGGRKVYAAEIEAAVDGLEGVRTGCSTIVEQPGNGRQRLTLLVELKDGQEDYASLAKAAAGLAMTKAAVALDECLFLEKGSLPKTPSGKIQRYRCRQMLDSGGIEPLRSIELAPA